MPSSSLRDDAQSIFRAAVAAVDPVASVRQHVVREGSILLVDSTPYDLEHYRRVYVVGAGKAGATMAQGIEEVLGGQLGDGTVTVKYDHVAPLNRVKLQEAGHPIPDAAGIAGAEAMIRLVREAGEHDLVLCLLSGGGSALLPAPCRGITLDDKQQLTRVLLDCGASIDEINTLRKHLSRVKGGQLAREIAPASLLTLVLSDVVGDRLDVIASGPTVPDLSTFQDCWDIVARYGLRRQLPDAIRWYLDRGQLGEIAETPKPGDPVFARSQTVLVGSNRFALEAAGAAAKRLGYTPLLLSSSVQGEAREIARMHAAIGQEVRQRDMPVSAPACILSGGETTVTMRGDGKGGRSQEFALAAAFDIAGLDRIVVLSGGTDGTDGPTDAAGALVDGRTVSRAHALGLNPEHYLQGSDSYHFFAALDDLLVTGPTGTNVMDIHMVLVG